MLGLPKGKVVISQYQECWAELYEEERHVIWSSIHEYVLNIHHVGSTSVEGLKAKPVIDMAVELRSFDDGFHCISLLAELGYRHAVMDVLPDRHYWRKGEPRTHQIHMYESGNLHLTDLIKFRDCLRADASLRDEYSAMKERLLAEYENDRHAYTDAKGTFIRRVLAGTRV